MSLACEKDKSDVGGGRPPGGHTVSILRRAVMGLLYSFRHHFDCRVEEVSKRSPREGPRERRDSNSGSTGTTAASGHNTWRCSI